MSAAPPDEEFIRACYQVILGRPPDAAGLEAHLNTLRNGARDMAATLEAFVSSKEFGNHLKHFLYQYQAARRLLDNSQHNELAYILRWLIAHGAQNSFIVDVGACSQSGSNSFDLLAHFGWKGLLFEANPHLLPAIQRDFAGLDMTLVHTAIGTTEGTAELFLGVNPGISSLLEHNTSAWGPVSSSVSVTVRRLPDLLDEHQTPKHFDILTIDIEGLDVGVFNDLITSSDYRPRLVVIESGAVTDLAAKGFCPQVVAQYRVWENCGPNAFLEFVN